MSFSSTPHHRSVDDENDERRHPPPGYRPPYSDPSPPLVPNIHHTHYGEAPPPPPPSYVAYQSNFPPEPPVTDNRYSAGPPVTDNRYSSGPPFTDNRYSSGPPVTDYRSSGPTDYRYFSGQPVTDYRYSSKSPPPAEHYHSHHSHSPTVVHQHSHQSDSPFSNRPTVKVYAKANPNFSLAIRDGKVVLVPSDPHDPAQHWFKDEKYSTRIKDEEGCPCFALVNKATGQALKHSTGASHPVQLIVYDPNVVDESVLWTQSKEFGEGYRAIRMVNNIHLNVDAFHGDKYSGGVHDGTQIVLWKWKEGENQLWKIVPY